jgi:TRAP-type C4-dicarboxylate transport system permease small subunit
MEAKKEKPEELLPVRVGECYRKVCLVMAIVAMSAICLMSFSTSMDVLKRWITGWPFEGVMQLNECLMVVMVFLGLAFAQFHRRHIRIAFVVSHLKPKKIVIADIISCGCAMICLALMAWKTLEEGIWSCSILEYRFGNVRMPVYWARMLIPIGLVGMIGQLIIDIWTNIVRLEGKLPLEIADVRRVKKEDE